MVVLLMVKGVSTNETSTASMELEGFDGEWEVLIIWVIDEEAVYYGLLKASGFVTWGDDGTTFSSCSAVFHSGGLCEVIIVHLDVVNNDSPLVAGVNSSEWSDVSCFRWAQIGFLLQ